MSSKLYCHIGMQKAGSKAIQHFSAVNAEELVARGYRYPRDLGKGVWHREVFEGFSNVVAERIQRLCEANPSVILSFEKAYTANDNLIDELAGCADEMHVLFFVREPVSWVNSWINQIVKAHRSPHRSFAEFSVDQRSTANALDIEQHLARWEARTTRERITAIEYDSVGDVVLPYLDWLGI
ncbi:MAG: hypothetical protein AAFW98_00105, partial [Pseudomonadota bacterium]